MNPILTSGHNIDGEELRRIEILNRITRISGTI